uniref:Spermatogenesis associated 18 n=1 Tax=Callorhinchus milii TaxID=7868 RepID=A0A4W3IDS5_CALMI
MAEPLRRMVSAATYRLLQSRLEAWSKDYPFNTCDQNLNRCCELIELTSKVQGQLFSIFNLAASEGGLYSGAGTIKSRFLPWLGSSFTVLSSRLSSDTSTHSSLQKIKTIMCEVVERTTEDSLINNAASFR